MVTTEPQENIFEKPALDAKLNGLNDTIAGEKLKDKYFVTLMLS